MTNSLIQGDNPFAPDNIARVAIDTATFLTGLILRKSYPQVLMMGKKYHLQTVKISSDNKMTLRELDNPK